MKTICNDRGYNQTVSSLNRSDIENLGICDFNFRIYSRNNRSAFTCYKITLPASTNKNMDLAERIGNLLKTRVEELEVEAQTQRRNYIYGTAAIIVCLGGIALNMYLRTLNPDEPS